jgi:dGTPase
MSLGNTERQQLWAACLSPERIYGKVYPAEENQRTEFQKDYDRIVFSSAFRRLQDKTQVFPLSQTDFTRTRLTHTLEASAVGRTLGLLAAQHLEDVNVQCEASDIGTIVATATLAHDLGNPPFGHSGEAAIQRWAKRRLPTLDETIGRQSPTPKARRKNAASIPMGAEELADFLWFEGNAQGFRIITRTGVRDRKGGFRLTVATLAAMAKYPRPSIVRGYQFDPERVSEKKPGYFQNDRSSAVKAFRAVRMKECFDGVFARHPLAFLTEAADDICYAVADVEDAAKLGVVTFEEVSRVLLPLAELHTGFADKPYLSKAARLGMMRSAAVGSLVSACTTAFKGMLETIEDGKLYVSLVNASPVADKYRTLKNLAAEKVYTHERVLQIEYAGFQTIGGLLDMFYEALCEGGDDERDAKLRGLFPTDLLRRPRSSGFQAIEEKDPARFYLELMTKYERLLAVTDYVSGMTDRFAVQLFQRLSGIRLPE